MTVTYNYRSLLLILFATSAFAADDSTQPRVGYYKISATPVDILGASGSQGVAGILPPDEKIDWEIVVPDNYSPGSPPGLIVYISPSTFGGPPRDWNATLRDFNLIWIGARKSGNQLPVAERMIKAMIAPTFIRQSYVVDPERVYVAGFSGGGKTATRVATVRPELFKGGVYMGGAVFWGDKTPPKIDLIRQNYHVFLIGSNDPGLRATQRAIKDYKEAGVSHSMLITISNYKHRMPPAGYFEKALTYLDSRSAE